MQDVESWFSRANLPVKVENIPLMRDRSMANVEDIFQLGIEKKRDGTEHFRLYRGHKDNIVQVLDSDKDSRQVLLFVKEPRRSYQVYNREKEKYETRATPEEARKYLLGKDERFLFIAELPNARRDFARGRINTVKDAHRALKPKELQADRNAFKRQGEWFFAPATAEERALIEENDSFAKKKERISKGGNAHAADYLLRLGDKVFVKGKVRHPQHHTVVLSEWSRAMRNQEVHSSFVSGLGVPRIVGFVD